MIGIKQQKPIMPIAPQEGCEPSYCVLRGSVGMKPLLTNKHSHPIRDEHCLISEYRVFPTENSYLLFGCSYIT